MTAGLVVDRVRKVTDKPIKCVVLSHYHAVRVLGASAYKAQEILASETCRAMIAERGQEDWDSEFGRFPRLFRAAETLPGLTWPTVTFKQKMTLYLGKRRVELRHIPRAHRRRHRCLGARRQRRLLRRRRRTTACYCGDAHFTDWPSTLGRLDRVKADALVPGRRRCAGRRRNGGEGIALTRDFLRDSYEPVKRGVARGASLKESSTRRRLPCGPSTVPGRSSSTASPSISPAPTTRPRASTRPAFWTAERDRAMWAAPAGLAAHEAVSMRNPILIELTRGALVESTHAGAVAVVRRRRRGGGIRR